MKTWQLKTLWDSVKAFLRGKLIAIHFYLKKQEKTSNTQLTFTSKTIGKSRTKLKKKNSRRKEIINIWTEINGKKMKETIEKINKIKSWFLETVNKIEKPLARLIKIKNKIHKIRNEKGEVTTENSEIKNDYKRLLWSTIWQ